MSNFIKKYGVLLLIVFCCAHLRAADQGTAAPRQVRLAHPGPRPIPGAGETQQQYSGRIAAWEELMKVYETAQGAQEEEKKEAAVRAEGNAGWSADTPDEALAAWLAKQRAELRKRAPDVEAAIGQRAVTDIGKIILPEIEQESIVLPGGGALSVAISPNGRYIRGFAPGDLLKIWDIKNLGAQPLLLKDLAGAVFLSGDRLAVLDKNRRKIQAFDIVGRHLSVAWTIDLKKQRLLKNLDMTESFLFASPDGRSVALQNVQDAHKARFVLVWNVQDLKRRPKKFETGFTRPRGNIFSPDSRYLVVSNLGKLRLWRRADSGRFFKEFIELGGDVGADSYVVFSSNGRYLLAMGTEVIAVWDMHDLHKEPRIKKFEDQLFAAYFLPDSDDIVIVKSDEDDDLISEVYDIRNIDAQPILLRAEYGGLASSDNRYQLFFSITAGKVYITDIQYPLNKDVRVRSVSGIAFLPNGKYLVTASEDEVRLWNWGLLTREMARQRARLETEDKKQRPGESWFDWTKRIRDVEREVNEEEQEEGEDSDDD